MTADREGTGLRIGVVLEAFLDWPLEQVMAWLRRTAPEVTDLEIGPAGTRPIRTATWLPCCASGQARVGLAGRDRPGTGCGSTR